MPKSFRDLKNKVKLLIIKTISEFKYKRAQKKPIKMIGLLSEWMDFQSTRIVKYDIRYREPAFRQFQAH